MAKFHRPANPEEVKAAQARQARREFTEKAWSIIVIVVLCAVVGYSLYIQVLHHP